MDARILAAGLLLLAPLGAHSQSYSVTDLGAGSAASINDSGQVAGSFTVGPGGQSEFAAIWSNGELSLAGPVGGYSAATSINNAGIAAGWTATEQSYASFFKGGSFTLLPAWQNTYPGMQATGINNSGVVVGTIFEGDQFAGGVWSAGCTTGSSACTVEGLRGVGERSYQNQFFTNAFGINDAGVVVGTTYFSEPGSSPTSVATVWTNGNPAKLGYLPGVYNAHAIAINDSGIIVGDSYARGTYASTAVEWKGTVATALAMLSATTQDSVSAINNAGLIVGEDNNLAALWDDGKVINLNTALGASLPAGVTLEDAVGINSKGQIVANGSNGQISVLTPSSAAPEMNLGAAASAAALLLGGLAVLHGRRT
jgi:uncharacterized membrane protein